MCGRVVSIRMVLPRHHAGLSDTPLQIRDKTIGLDMVISGKSKFDLNDDRGIGQAVRYEWSTVSFKLPDTKIATDAVEQWCASETDGGTYLGSWLAENGRLGRAYTLRRFDDAASMLDARTAQRLDGHPLSKLTDSVADLLVESFAPLPPMGAVDTGALGPVYEIRDYRLFPGTLPRSIAGWSTALPRRQQVNPVALVMYAIDGPDRIVHIVPFEGLDERIKTRKEIAENGVWPPRGGPESIAEGDSTIAWPLAGSPMQ